MPRESLRVTRHERGATAIRVAEVSSLIRVHPPLQSEKPASAHMQVFLCHSSADKDRVRELYHRLRAESFDPWLDVEKLRGGQDWEFEIKKAVRRSGVVIVCLSQDSISKEGYVQKEIKLALDVADEKPEGTIFVIPLKLEECNVPDRLRKLQWVDYFREDGFERLRSALAKAMADRAELKSRSVPVRPPPELPGRNVPFQPPPAREPPQPSSARPEIADQPRLMPQMEAVGPGRKWFDPRNWLDPHWRQQLSNQVIAWIVLAMLGLIATGVYSWWMIEPAPTIEPRTTPSAAWPPTGEFGVGPFGETDCGGCTTASYFAQTFQLDSSRYLTAVKFQLESHPTAPVGNTTHFRMLITEALGVGELFKPGRVIFESVTLSLEPRAGPTPFTVTIPNLLLTPGLYALVMDSFRDADGLVGWSNVAGAKNHSEPFYTTNVCATGICGPGKRWDQFPTTRADHFENAAWTSWAHKNPSSLAHEIHFAQSD
jgi:TIR domain